MITWVFKKLLLSFLKAEKVIMTSMTTITISPPSAQGSKKVESAKKEESKEKLMVSNQREREMYPIHLSNCICYAAAEAKKLFPLVHLFAVRSSRKVT